MRDVSLDGQGSPPPQTKGREGLIVHKFRVGESVHYTSNVLRRFNAPGSFRIVKLLPSAGDELQYRIKSATEPHERVAKESQLDLAINPIVALI